MKLTFETVGNTSVELETSTPKTAIEALAFFHSLPTACPIDDEPTIFSHRSPDGNDYYELLSTGSRPFACQIHQKKDSDAMYCKNVWTIYDHAIGQRITVWENGALTEQGQNYVAGRPVGAPQFVTNLLAKTQAANGKPLTKPAAGKLIKSLDDEFNKKGAAILSYLADQPVTKDAPPSAEFAKVSDWLADTDSAAYKVLQWVAAQEL